MYFFKESGKQVLDLTGNLILSFNSDLVKARAPSAAPDSIKNRKSISIHKLTNPYKKLKATFIVIGFIWGKDQQLTEIDTALNKPYVKPVDTPARCIHLHENKGYCIHINNLDNSCLGYDECKDYEVEYADTETEGREPCPVINKHCEFYAYQCDSNGEVAIDYCKHPENISDTEGNAITRLCPLPSFK